ncbi:hypothetical protein A0H81_04380 [Grifola frondosa]|uniref:Uncharacterized protein n=1 Tax=Grifola frondosa TaxID=5627 RepID=A0A1C7MFR6_GRIFR|nr:hypothetical protein A0H81_04380 [Grifola frondosa]
MGRLLNCYRNEWAYIPSKELEMALEALFSTRAQRAMVGTEAIVVLVMVAITFRFVAENVDLTLSRYKTISCYLALFALAEIFEILMAFDALRLRSVIQLAGLLIFHLALLVFAALQVHETRTALVTDPDATWMTDYVNGGGAGTLWQKVLPFLIVAPVVIGVAWLVMLFYVRQLYYEFGWAIFHVVGANPAMKTMYQYYQVMICLLKFDFFCFTGVTMQLLILVLATNSAEFGLTIAAIPIVLVLLIGCGIAVQREIKWLMSISLVVMLAAQSYFYKLVRFYEPSSRDQYATTRATLTTFTIVAFLLLFATFAVGLRCFADFDKGLQRSKLHGQSYKPIATSFKQSLFDVTFRQRYSSTLKNLAGEKKDDPSAYNAGSQLGPRISIE